MTKDKFKYFCPQQGQKQKIVEAEELEIIIKRELDKVRKRRTGNGGKSS